MEMLGRRSGYALLSTDPDEGPPPRFPDSLSSSSDRWRPPFPKASQLQRQSSGSSYGGSSLSGDYYLPSAAADFEISRSSPALKTASPTKSWAQQAEEAYQLQLAVALRLCTEATCTHDSSFLDPQQTPASTDSISHRFWVISSFFLTVCIIKTLTGYVHCPTPRFLFLF